MRKLYLLGLLALAGTIIGFAWAEQITLSTYYPAPYGVYKEFTTTSKTCLATNPLGIGGGEDANSMVGIGTTSPQAKLEVNSTTSGFLPPRMTTTRRNNINLPPAGSVIYNTDEGRLNFYNGSNWLAPGGWQNLGQQVFSGSPPTPWNPPNWTTLVLSNIVGAKSTLVMLKVINNGGGETHYIFRPSNDPNSSDTGGNAGEDYGCSGAKGFPGRSTYITITTGSDGNVEWCANDLSSTTIILVGFMS